ncbi:MAG TPA: hypothetical protein VK964_15320 [Nocardioidaceae bacterium]|nr:hypothetical protein [Nocardioidaceae bacterium]
MSVRIPSDHVEADTSVSLRPAGWAGVVAASAFLVQPLSVAFLPFDLQEIHDPVELTSYWWAGSLQAAQFLLIALAVLVMVTQLRRTWPRSALGDVAVVAGAVTAAAFLLEAALSAATYSRWLMMETVSFSDDPTVRGAVLFSTYVVGYSFLGAASLATAVWLVGVVFLGRRRAYVGLAMSVILLALAMLLVVGTVTGFAIPTAILHVVAWAVLGVRLLRISSLPLQASVAP